MNITYPYISSVQSDDIVCPYCSTVYEPSYEDTFIGGEQADCYTEDKYTYTCDNCGKQFAMYGILQWSYVTETIDGEMTYEEHQEWKQN